MLALLCLLGAVADKPALTNEEILRKAVERYAWSDAQKFDKRYVWTFHEIGEEFDSNGQVKTHTDRVMQVVPLSQDGRARRLLEKDGKPVSEAERKAQWERERKSIAEGNQNRRRGRPRKQGEEDDVSFNSELVSHYKWTSLGTETIGGRPAYVFAMEPKSKDLPVHHMMDRVLNKVAGKIWFDAEEFEIVRADAHLTGDATLLGGLAGAMRKADIFFEQTRMNDGAWLTSKVNFHIDARIVLKSIRFHQIQEFRDFRKVTPELIAESQRPPSP